MGTSNQPNNSNSGDSGEGEGNIPVETPDESNGNPPVTTQSSRDESRFELEDQVVNHPMDAFKRFASLSTGSSYAQSFAVLLNELATHTIVEVGTKEELLEFAEMAGRPVMGIVSLSGEKGLGTMSMADPNTGKVSSILGEDRFEDIEQRLGDAENELEQINPEAITELIQQSQQYDYQQSMHVEMARRTWELINVEDFMFRSSDTQVVDGGYFRDNIMADPNVAEPFAESEIGMIAVFSVDELVF